MNKKKQKLPERVAGELVLNRLCEQLKCYSDDSDEYLRRYKESCKKLSFEDAIALKACLEYAIDDLEHNFSELASGREESLEQELKDTYKKFLSALESVRH